jgi:hypothetical protein
LGEGAVHDLSRLETEQGKAAAPDSEALAKVLILHLSTFLITSTEMLSLIKTCSKPQMGKHEYNTIKEKVY